MLPLMMQRAIYKSKHIRSLASLAVKDLKIQNVATVGGPVSGSDVLVKMIAAPINASDLSTTTSGSEGVGMVAAMGEKVTGLREGDWVFPPLGTSTWASEMIVDSSKLMRVSSFFKNLWLLMYPP